MHALCMLCAYVAHVYVCVLCGCHNYCSLASSEHACTTPGQTRRDGSAIATQHIMHVLTFWVHVAALMSPALSHNSLW